MTDQTASKFLNDLIQKETLPRQLKVYLQDGSFSLADLTTAANQLGYTFNSDELKLAYQRQPSQQNTIDRILIDKLGWKAPVWLL